jgi:branched-chain amino acid transport system permease protein
MELGLLAQLGVDGLVAGCAYATLGVSFGLIYGPTRIVHFAHGSVYTFAAYAMWLAAVPLHLSLTISAVVGFAVATFLGLLCYLVAYRPLERKRSSSLGILITSLGLYIVFENLVGVTLGSDTKVVADQNFGVFVIGNVVVTGLQALMVLSSVVIVGVVAGLLTLTNLGRSVRAMSDSPRLATIIGIKTQTISATVFVLGSAICAAPAMIALLQDGAQPYMGFAPSLIGYVVVMVGGVGSLWGAVGAGILLGMVEHVGMLKLPTEWQSTVAFAALVIVLLIQPRKTAYERE